MKYLIIILILVSSYVSYSVGRKLEERNWLIEQSKLQQEIIDVEIEADQKVKEALAEINDLQPKFIEKIKYVKSDTSQCMDTQLPVDIIQLFSD